MIMTDEHNFRTLGCYRDLMEQEQAFPWGEGVKVDTPNLDKLAQDGAIYKNFYTVAPRKYNVSRIFNKVIFEVIYSLIYNSLYTISSQFHVWTVSISNRCFQYQPWKNG